MSSGVTPNSISGYTGPTLPELRRDPEASALAQRALSILMQEIPALAPAPSAVSQPVPGVLPATGPGLLPPHLGRPQLHPAPAVYPSLGDVLPPQPSRVDPNQARLDLLQQQLDQLRLQQHQDQLPVARDSLQEPIVSLEDLANRTIKCKQYKALDFAKIGTFPYTSQIKQSNLSMALFSYGSFRHLLYLIDGTLPPVKPSELIARVQHLVNVFEIVSLSSSLTDFDSTAWRIGKAYNDRIVSDIEFANKSWDTLDKGIDSTAWQLAKELVVKAKTSQTQNRPQGNNSNSTKICTTWNTFRKEGCYYEYTNPGEVCVFQHICSRCKRRHKAWQCPSPEEKSGSASSSALTAPASTAATPTTSA